MPRSIRHIQIRRHVDLRFSRQSSKRFVQQNSVENLQPGVSSAATFGRQERPLLLQRSKRDRQGRTRLVVRRVATPAVQEVRHFAQSNCLSILLGRFEVNFLILGQRDRIERVAAIRGQDLVGPALAFVVRPERDAAASGSAFVTPRAGSTLGSVAGVGQS